MVRITAKMARVGQAALAWYGDLCDHGGAEFAAPDFPAVPGRNLRRYMAQLQEAGWCAFEIRRRRAGSRPTVYAVIDDIPAADAPPDHRPEAEAFVSCWAVRPESNHVTLNALEYLSLRAAIAPETSTSRFERALTSKLLELAATPALCEASASRRLAWLRMGVAMTVTTMPLDADGAGSVGTSFAPAQHFAYCPPEKAAALYAKCGGPTRLYTELQCERDSDERKP